MVIHCHRLEHEDEGLMGVFYINGGCDADYSALGSRTCAPETCDSDALWSAYNWSNESAAVGGIVCNTATSTLNSINITNILVIVGLVVAALIIVAFIIYVVRECVQKRDDVSRNGGNVNVEPGGTATHVVQQSPTDGIPTEDAGLIIPGQYL